MHVPAACNEYANRSPSRTRQQLRLISGAGGRDGTDRAATLAVDGHSISGPSTETAPASANVSRSASLMPPSKPITSTISPAVGNSGGGEPLDGLLVQHEHRCGRHEAGGHLPGEQSDSRVESHRSLDADLSPGAPTAPAGIPI